MLFSKLFVIAVVRCCFEQRLYLVLLIWVLIVFCIVITNDDENINIFDGWYCGVIPKALKILTFSAPDFDLFLFL